jgi:hypothetical protein
MTRLRRSKTFPKRTLAAEGTGHDARIHFSAAC